MTSKLRPPHGSGDPPADEVDVMVVRRQASSAGQGLQRRRPLPRHFSPAKQELFFAHLAEHANIRAAARHAGVCAQTVWRWRGRNPEFARRWLEALAQGYDNLEMHLLAIVGRVDAVVAATQSSQIDEDGWIDVTLLRPDMHLANAGPFDLLAGRNMAMAGAELLQFGHAEPLGDSLWRLTRLLRGRIGTENAMASLAPGAPFALIEGAAPLPVPASIGLLPVTPMAEILLADLGTGERLSLALPSTDRSRVPLSPVHLRHAWRDDGGLDVRWIRRSWAGHAWRDGSDVPLDEAVERYRVTVAAGALAIDVECLSPWLSFSAAQIAAWREAASLAVITVRQLGAWGASAGATDTAML